MLNSNIDTTIINSQGSSYYLDKDITLKGNPLLKRYHGNEQKINTRIINNANRNDMGRNNNYCIWNWHGFYEGRDFDRHYILGVRCSD